MKTERSDGTTMRDTGAGSASSDVSEGNLAATRRRPTAVMTALGIAVTVAAAIGASMLSPAREIHGVPEHTQRLVGHAGGADHAGLLRRFGSAYRAYLEADLAHARELLEDLYLLDASFLPATTLLGRVAYFQSDYERAATVLRGVLETEPHHIDAAKWLVRAHLANRDAEAAERILRRTREVSAEDPELLLLLAETALAAGKVDRAVAATEQALAFRGALAEAALQVAIIYRSAGVTELGNHYLNVAAALSPLPTALGTDDGP